MIKQLKISQGRITLCSLALCLAACGQAQLAVAQCDTCATPTVAYQPVQPVAVVATQQRTGWYPGRLLDRLRMRTWGAQPVAAPTYAAPTYTAAYAPTTYSAGYSPYTAGYAPYTASSTPYVTAYAPLQRTTVLYRSVALRPVIADAGCSTCNYTPATPCSDCGVSQAAYSAPTGGCSNCEASSGTPSYAYEDGGSWRSSEDYGSGASPDPATPQPALEPEPASERSYYRGESLASARELAALRDRIDQLEREREAYTSRYREESPQREPEESILRKAPAEEDDFDSGFPGKFDPDQYNPDSDEGDSDASYNTPSWKLPESNQTARGPSVNVWNAVYKRSAPHSQQVSTRRSVSKPLTQAEIDAQGWSAVHRNR
ncbi:hypothetical protein [Adhaeretor mobilis]|uniref:Uncharacterized protein n=1 Tax=Adhaeretor mobilis TaxID=1930276 RepID=A0A517MVX9_9BACT|nr:hypothetical protein [Adhaeretor mobilis]QDS99029.1 hypothetical protein HG15A2_23180 [Adhaeretor mobilis]